MDKSCIFPATTCDLGPVRPCAGPVKCPDSVRSVRVGAGSVVSLCEGRDKCQNRLDYDGKKADKYLQTNLHHIIILYYSGL